MSAVVSVTGQVSIIRQNPPKIERVTPADFGNLPGAEKLARVTNAQTDAILSLVSQVQPPYTDFEVKLTGTVMSIQELHLQHGYTGAVRWWFVDQDVALPNVSTNTSQTVEGTLVLQSLSSGTFVIRVSPRGV